ncbi:outer membrane lipoprotein carrier protein LolA [bacterium]|nr:outer membrane lipoprotein carrier protein LolA [bacterium]
MVVYQQILDLGIFMRLFERRLKLAVALGALSGVLLVFSAVLVAGENVPTAGTILAKVQERYRTILRIKADFTQVTFNATMGKEQTASGVYYAERPGKVRWDYKKPEPQYLLVVAGKVEFFVPQDKQLVVNDASQVEEMKAVLDLLGGKKNVMERFKARLDKSAASKDEGGEYKIGIVPREPMGALLRLVLSIDKKTLLVRGTDYFDVYGNKTRVTFSNISMPKSFDKNLFRLDLPTGVAVMDSAGNSIPNYISSRGDGSTSSSKSKSGEGRVSE